jgi:polysaccharide pyruvyl transferase WcaK-like protein
MLVERVTGIRPIVAADPLFLPAALRKLPPPVEAQGERICVNLRDDAPPQLIDALGTLLAKRIDEGARVTLLATDRRPDRDPAALGALAEKLDSRSVDVLPSDVGWRAAYEAISQSTLCVGMRLHFCIFSAVARRRLLVLSSTPKTKSFINDLQLAHRPIESAHDDIASGLDEARTADEPGLTHMATRANRALEAILG